MPTSSLYNSLQGPMQAGPGYFSDFLSHPLSSLMWFLTSHLASWLFPEMQVCSIQDLCTCCSFCLAHCSFRFSSGSLPHFLRGYAQVPSSQRYRPDHYVRTHAHTHMLNLSILTTSCLPDSTLFPPQHLLPSQHTTYLPFHLFISYLCH